MYCARAVAVAQLVFVVCLGRITDSALSAQAMDARSADLTVTAASHGIRLSQTLPGRQFPRDALVPVTVRAKNVSNHPIYLWPPDGFGNGSTFPQAQVIGPGGRVLFPPALHPPFIGPVPAPMRVSLGAGASIVAHSYVVLRTGRVRGVVFVDHSDKFPGYILSTPVLNVTTVGPAAPTIHLVSSAQSPLHTQGAIFTPRETPAAGQLQYMEWHECFYPGADSLGQDGVYQWETGGGLYTDVRGTGGGTEITPLCPTRGGTSGSLVQWHIIAGWSRQSAVIFEYPHN